MRTLILSGKNVVSNGYNDTYKFDFPSGAVTFKNDQLALTSISMYYSWENISSSTTGGGYNNNAFSYVWLGTTVNITIPDGNYTISQLNAYLQSQMISNTHYLIDSDGNYVYYLEMVSNSTYYAVQLNAYAIPTSAQASTLSYTQPAGASWSFPATAETPQFVISSTNNFKTILGFSAGTYPSVTQSTNYSIVSNNGVPQVSPVASLVVQCNLLQNTYSIPSSLLYSFSPNVDYGEQILINVPEMAFVDISNGSYNSLIIQFSDQNLNRVAIQDTNLVILLTIKNKNEYTEKILS
jgi:hypothetical protein